MAHPYAGHKQEHVGRRRVNKLLHGKEYKRGGAAHGDEAEDRALIKEMMAEHEHKVSGHKGKHRIDKFARGGRTKKHGDVNVAVVVPHRAPSPSPAAAPAGGGSPPVPPPAPPLGPAMAGPGGPPMGGPPGMPPGMPMRARGGKVDGKGDFIPGESNPENLRRWQDYAKRNSYATGGATHRYPKMTAGQQSGVGRLESAHDQKRRRK